MDTFVVFGSRDNRSFVICATSKATNPLTVPIETNVGAVEYLGISPDLAPIHGGQPPVPPSGDAASQSSLRGLLSRGKAKSSALRSLNRLKDRVAPVVLNRSSRKSSRIPKPAVAIVVLI